MRAAVLLVIAAACRAPDRWNAGISRGEGDLTGPGGGDWDAESTRLELGVSGPLWGAPSTHRPPPMSAIGAPSEPTPAGSIPWLEIALLAGGALSYKGSEVGVKKYAARKKAS